MGWIEDFVERIQKEYNREELALLAVELIVKLQAETDRSLEAIETFLVKHTKETEAVKRLQHIRDLLDQLFKPE